ncbi:hypothetical protein ACLOJK_022743 [Asimina triloba]
MANTSLDPVVEIESQMGETHERHTIEEILDNLDSSLDKLRLCVEHLLVDSGSIENFISQRLTERINHLIEKIPSFKGHKYEVDLYPLDTSGIDVVLGYPWLESLGDIKCNW